MNLLNLTLLAHSRAVRENRHTPAERKDLEGYPMRWHDDDGAMTPVFDETRLSDRQEADIREILERMAGKTVRKDVMELVRAYMEAFGRFGARADDVAATLTVDKKTALKYLRRLAYDGLVVIREQKTRGGKGSPRKLYCWTQNQPEFGREDAFVEDSTDPESTDSNLRIQRDHNRGYSAKSEFGSGIVHHGSSVHALQCPARCWACQEAIRDVFEGYGRSAALQEGGTGFSVGLAERIAAREAAEEALFAKLESGNTTRGLSPAERSLFNRDLARKLIRSEY